MKLRRLTPEGIAAFSDYLDALEHERAGPVLQELLNDIRSSEPLAAHIEVEPRTFGSRFAAAEYFSNKFCGGELHDVETDAGLWSWLAVFYFDELCPPDPNGKRSPNERARYILKPGNFQRYYRHLLAGPYRIYRAHRRNPDIALAVLCQPLHKPGDVVEQLASRQELITNPAVMEAATRLYVNMQTRQLKRSVQTRNAGSVRRFVDVLNQFDVTWDLYVMSARELLDMLPEEFQRFQPAEDA